MQRETAQKLAEMGMTDDFFQWLRERAPAYVARDALLGLLCARALSDAENESLSESDRLGALLRYQREEAEFIASQPEESQPLIQGPTTEQLARFGVLLGEREQAVTEELAAFERARPVLLRERERLFNLMAPMTRSEQAREDTIIEECAALLRRIPMADPEQTIEEVAAAVRSNPAPYDTTEFEAKLLS